MKFYGTDFSLGGFINYCDFFNVTILEKNKLKIYYENKNRKMTHWIEYSIMHWLTLSSPLDMEGMKRFHPLEVVVVETFMERGHDFQFLNPLLRNKHQFMDHISLDQ